MANTIDHGGGSIWTVFRVRKWEVLAYNDGSHVQVPGAVTMEMSTCRPVKLGKTILLEIRDVPGQARSTKARATERSVNGARVRKRRADETIRS